VPVPVPVQVPEPQQIPNVNVNVPPPLSLLAPIPRDPRRTASKSDPRTLPPNEIPLCVPINSQTSTSQPPPQPALIGISFPVPKKQKEENINDDEAKEKESSGYAMTSHSADLITEDIYVSDGSDDEADGGDGQSEPLDLTLTASKMGLMRRGLRGAAMYQPKTWTRPESQEKEDEKDDTKEVSSDEEKEDTKNMDPAQRAAYLVVEKQRKEEEAQILKRKLESSENAGRDPCLFSKRTAFDIRMDQIEEKPWDREAGGTGDMTDYFNYGMGEEDWLDYSERQKMVRQELTDAGRQRRMPDPTIVPVAPKAPSRQAPRVAVAVAKKDEDEDDVSSEAVAVGPTLPARKGTDEAKDSDDNDDKSKSTASSSGLEGGAWGVPPGSKLAQLIEEQKRLESSAPPPPTPPRHMPPGPPPPQHHDDFHPPPQHHADFHHNNAHGGFRDHQQHNDFQHNDFQSNHYQQGGSQHLPPPPPRMQGDSWRDGRGGRGGRGDGRGFHPGRGGPPGRGYGPPGGRGGYGPPGGRGYGPPGGRGYPPPHMQHHGGGRFHGGRGFNRGGRGGGGNWRHY